MRRPTQIKRVTKGSLKPQHQNISTIRAASGNKIGPEALQSIHIPSNKLLPKRHHNKTSLRHSAKKRLYAETDIFTTRPYDAAFCTAVLSPKYEKRI